MRISIIDTDYPKFLKARYVRYSSRTSPTYEEQLVSRRKELFGLVEPYRRELSILGHAVDDIYLNDWKMQLAWAAEQDSSLVRRFNQAHLRMRRGVVPWMARGPSTGWFVDLLRSRIRTHQPDVVILLNMYAVGQGALFSIRALGPQVVGQHAATSLESVDLRPFDLVLSSFPPTVDAVVDRGIPARYLPLAFDDRALELSWPSERCYEVSFVGSLAPIHRPRRELLAVLADAVPGFVWWSPDKEFRRSSQALNRSYMGNAWGQDMYRVLSNSRITVNHHGSTGFYANNLRLYEATGLGAALVTDQKLNLSELFSVGSEVATYGTTKECIARVVELLSFPSKVQEIASAGQARTRREHLWSRRAPELLAMLEEVL